MANSKPTSIFDSIDKMTKITGTKKKGSSSTKGSFNVDRAKARVSQLESTCTRLNNTVEKRLADNKKTQDELDQVTLEYGILTAGINAVNSDAKGKELLKNIGLPKTVASRVSTIMALSTKLSLHQTGEAHQGQRHKTGGD